MASLMLVNPRKRRAKRKTARKAPSIARRVKTVYKKAARKYRRNPIGGSSRTNLTAQIKNAAIGAGGAVAVDILMAKLPLPANLKTGTMRSATQGLVSVGLGMAVAKFGKNRALGIALAEGGLTVALHGVLKSTVNNAMPTLQLAGDESLLGYEDLSGDLLGYEDMNQGVGWYSAAPVSEGFDDFN
jgi:hypothetical protein